MTKTNLTASIGIQATPEEIWEIVSDLRRMPEWSTQCRLMLPLGTPRMGGYTVNMNRQGRKYWPTASRIERFTPNQVVAFRTLTNQSVWSFEITATDDGSTLTHRRTVPPAGTGWGSRTIVDLWLGGEEPFDEEMAEGMHGTLAKIKATVEQSRAESPRDPAAIRPLG